MMLRLETQPEAYDADKAAILIDTDADDKMILIGCEGAMAVAKEIATRVNMFPAMVTVLTVFSSKEMGDKLIDAMFYDDGLNSENPQKQEAQRRMRKLINAVDVILKGIEIRHGT